MRILHQNIGAIAAALVIVIMLDPTTRAQDNIPRSSSAISAAAQPGHSPANAPNEVNEMPTSPPFGAPAGSTAELPQDLSVWGMFLHADRVVKAVMIGLALASLATWAIWLAKALELRRARSEVPASARQLQHAVRGPRAIRPRGSFSCPPCLPNRQCRMQSAAAAARQ
jgi:biopolymer transport protein ExbB